MTWLALGLALFLGMHLTRAVAPRWRDAQIARLGEKGWKGLYTVLSLAGFGLILWGYAQARLDPVVLWAPIRGMNHLAALLMLVAMVLIAAASLLHQVPVGAAARRRRTGLLLDARVKCVHVTPGAGRMRHTAELRVLARPDR